MTSVAERSPAPQDADSRRDDGGVSSNGGSLSLEAPDKKFHVLDKNFETTALHTTNTVVGSLLQTKANFPHLAILGTLLFRALLTSCRRRMRS